MSWIIKVFDMSNVLQKTFVDGVDIVTGEIGIESIDTATVAAPFGNCEELQFTGRNDVIQADAKNIIQYLEDDDAIFWGPLIIYPSKEYAGSGPETNNDALNRFVVAGGSLLLERSLLGPKLYDNAEYDIAEQMREMGIEFGHPALSWPETEMPVVGVTSKLAASPHRNLKDIFEQFQKSVPNSHYGVDGLGQVFFKVVS